KPDIENIYLSIDRDSDFETSGPDNDYSFSRHDPDIYLIIEVKRLGPEDEIKVEWLKIEDGSYDVIQKNIINPEKKGSGKIIISLIKHDGVYSAGNYIVETYLNGDKKITEEFYIQNRT
ncbi:MAG TPA: hypothetical protein VJ348_03070, partial [Candidatus Humimicrobiaceae bacterium]|nr:hypothetical protein [Candidatus Humimicrobiaceae bacterium]